MTGRNTKGSPDTTRRAFITYDKRAIDTTTAV